MLTFTNEDAHAVRPSNGRPAAPAGQKHMMMCLTCLRLQVVKKNLGSEGATELKGLDFLPFPDLEQGVRDDVAYLKQSKAIPGAVLRTRACLLAHLSLWLPD